jgi:hypothetical protein
MKLINEPTFAARLLRGAVDDKQTLATLVVRIG